MCMTGNGVTFAFTQISGGASPPATIGRIVSVNGFGIDNGEIEDNDIESTAMEYCVSDMVSHDILRMTVVFNPNTHIPFAFTHSHKLFIGTLTFQLSAGASTPASLGGTGFIKKFEIAGLENNTRVLADVEWRWDNKGVPLAFTAAA